MELTSIYQEVKSKIKDKYSIWNISDLEISKYLNNKVANFAKNNMLEDIEYIDKIISDIIEHKKNRALDMKKTKDSVLKYQNFVTVNESFFEMEKSGIEHEKVLADLFETSVGHVECIDEEKHIYSITDFGVKEMVCVLSEKDFEMIKTNITKIMIEEISAKNLVIDEVENVKLDVELLLCINEILDKSKLESWIRKTVVQSNVICLVENYLKDTVLSDFKDIEFIKKFSNHYVWKFV